MSKSKQDLAWAFAILQEALLKMPTRKVTVDNVEHAFVLREDVLCSVERVASQYLTEAELEKEQHVQSLQPAMHGVSLWQEQNSQQRAPQRHLAGCGCARFSLYLPQGDDQG